MMHLSQNSMSFINKRTGGVYTERYVLSGKTIQLHLLADGQLTEVKELTPEDKKNIEVNLRPRSSVWQFFHKHGLMVDGRFI